MITDKEIYNLASTPCRHCGKVDSIIANIYAFGKAEEHFHAVDGELQRDIQTDYINYSRPKIYRCGSCGKKRA